jgi:hypothetical protein
MAGLCNQREALPGLDAVVAALAVSVQMATFVPPIKENGERE